MNSKLRFQLLVTKIIFKKEFILSYGKLHCSVSVL